MFWFFGTFQVLSPTVRRSELLNPKRTQFHLCHFTDISERDVMPLCRPNFVTVFGILLLLLLVVV